MSVTTRLFLAAEVLNTSIISNSRLASLIRSQCYKKALDNISILHVAVCVYVSIHYGTHSTHSTIEKSNLRPEHGAFSETFKNSSLEIHKVKVTKKKTKKCLFKKSVSTRNKIV